ncbi:MAG: phage baseplate assembly protein V [Candidatus Thiodiazotropha sp.]|nr:phage baseplate assembly protein V [Candidatus Thiodiazotropha sp.]MCM8921766.1 phage baseplate assembly protein V [Candidatus Thiodiazotropha sp.]
MRLWSPTLVPPSPASEPSRQRLFGVYPGVVTDLLDPDDQGRVKVRLPWVGEDDSMQATAWARLATLMAGADRGSWFIPEVDDEVLLSFLAGDPRHPVVLGALWNGVDTPPESMDGGGENNIRSITSRSGHKLEFDDTSGGEKITLVTQGGHELVLDDASGGTITVNHSGGAQIVIESSGTISVTALNQINIDAPAGLNVTAAMVTVDSAFSKFSGVVKADTVITNAVVSSSYTPGAGNVW